MARSKIPKAMWEALDQASPKDMLPVGILADWCEENNHPWGACLRWCFVNGKRPTPPYVSNGRENTVHSKWNWWDKRDYRLGSHRTDRAWKYGFSPDDLFRATIDWDAHSSSGKHSFAWYAFAETRSQAYSNLCRSWEIYGEPEEIKDDPS